MPYKDREKKTEARRRWRANRSPEQRAIDNARARVRHHRAWQNATEERKAAVRARKRLVTSRWYRNRSEEQKVKDRESKRRSKARRKLLAVKAEVQPSMLPHQNQDGQQWDHPIYRLKGL
jgi:hypothetical protein